MRPFTVLAIASIVVVGCSPVPDRSPADTAPQTPSSLSEARQVSASESVSVDSPWIPGLISLTIADGGTSGCTWANEMLPALGPDQKVTWRVHNRCGASVTVSVDKATPAASEDTSIDVTALAAMDFGAPTRYSGGPARDQHLVFAGCQLVVQAGGHRSQVANNGPIFVLDIPANAVGMITCSKVRLGEESSERLVLSLLQGTERVPATTSFKRCESRTDPTCCDALVGQ